MKYSSQISTLLQEHDSFYLYDQGVIQAQIARLQKHFPGVQFLYSLKCNPNPTVLDTIFAAGVGGDAASLAEVNQSVARNVPTAHIQYSAPGKSVRDIRSALGRCTLIADSLTEVSRIQEVAADAGVIAEIGVRINPNFTIGADTLVPGKFGIDEAQALSAIPSWLALPNVRIVGIHVHARSQVLDLEGIFGYYKNLFRLLARMESALGYPLTFLNMGSGMGIPYEADAAPLDVETLGRKTTALLSSYRETHPDLQVYIETGRYLVGKSGVYVTRVADIKVSGDTKFVLLNNTLNGFVRPSIGQMVSHYAPAGDIPGSEPMFTSRNAFQFTTTSTATEMETVTLVGNLCTGTDVMASDIILPALSLEDAVVVSNAGAYARVLSPLQFSSQVAPGEFVITANGEILGA